MRSLSTIGDRAAGAVLASACADALGGPFEFGPPLPPAMPLGMGGGAMWELGEWTDDTQMALAILTPLASGDTSLQAVEARFLEWFRSHPADVGNQTSAVLSTGAPLREASARYARAHPDSAGNGGLMRIGPAALAFPGRPELIAEYAAAVTRLTHPADDCIDASVLWALAIDDALHNAPEPNAVWDFADSLRRAASFVPAERRDRWLQLIDEACDRPAVSFANNGWVVHAFQAALASIVSTPIPASDAPCRHLQLAIETAVRCGRDADTVAAITGALLGARWGATAVPLAWRSVLHGKRVYGQPELDATDLDALARLAVGGGVGDALGWPGAGRLTPYYLETFPQQPLVVAYGGVVFGNIAGLAQALDQGVDVVISLCRMGRDDVPAPIQHAVIGLIDSSDPSDNPNLHFVLEDAASFIADQVAARRSVYVHCVRAESRTPLVAAAYRARREGGSGEEALRWAEDAFGTRVNRALAKALHRGAPSPTSTGQHL